MLANAHAALFGGYLSPPKGRAPFLTEPIRAAAVSGAHNGQTIKERMMSLSVLTERLRCRKRLSTSMVEGELGTGQHAPERVFDCLTAIIITILGHDSEQLFQLCAGRLS